MEFMGQPSHELKYPMKYIVCWQAEEWNFWESHDRFFLYGRNFQWVFSCGCFY